MGLPANKIPRANGPTGKVRQGHTGVGGPGRGAVEAGGWRCYPFEGTAQCAGLSYPRALGCGLVALERPQGPVPGGVLHRALWRTDTGLPKLLPVEGTHSPRVFWKSCGNQQRGPLLPSTELDRPLGNSFLNKMGWAHLNRRAVRHLSVAASSDSAWLSTWMGENVNFVLSQVGPLTGLFKGALPAE